MLRAAGAQHTTRENGLIKEYYGKAPVLNVYMNDSRLPAPYYGQLGRTSSDWRFVAVDESSSNTVFVTVSLTTQTFWTSVGADGTWWPRHGYFLTFLRQGAPLYTYNLGPTFGGGGGDICGNKSNPWFPRFTIPRDIFVAMDSVSVVANSDQMWACR
jgi:hypothetical protein